MPQIIAGLYELNEKIGAGGGGVVYLGRHIRLNKEIVLKADKRTLATDTESLRREVDLLKGLSHTYIPQVYDFVQEDGVVYTVMDYIDGVSLDKLIAQGNLPSQSELIHWSCQLLQALEYLHTKEPYGILHGDIKPANIMKRTNGDMCLIDYNIALALGEDGAVKVGFSRGYASPEHYGADYLVGNQGAAINSQSQFRNSSFFHGKRKTENFGKTVREDDGSEKTILDDGSEKTQVLSDQNGEKSSTGSSSKTSSGKGLLLDARSDIYSLGATLYHLISGKKPAQDAREVEPLGPEVCSEALWKIISKAMAPQPADRFQTAKEMLNAFQQIHETDKRTIKHRKRIKIATVGLAAMFLAGGASTFVGLKQLEQRQSALTFAEYSANALAEGDASTAISYALKAIPGAKDLLAAPVTAQAQKALTDALGVYNLADGFQTLDGIHLPGAPFGISRSPEGRYLAVVYAYETAVYDLTDFHQVVRLPVQESALSDCLFVDENHIIYAGTQGVTCYDLEKKSEVWVGKIATTLTLSGNRKVVAAIDRGADQVILYDTGDGTVLGERTFGGLHLHVPVNDIFADAANDLFALNAEGSMLALSFHNGGLQILDLSDPSQDLILFEESDYEHFAGGFYGKYLAFSAEKNGEAQFGIADVREAVFVGGYTAQKQILLQADERGVYLASENLLVKVDPETLNEQEVAYTGDRNIISFCAGEDFSLVALKDGGFAFYDLAANRIYEDVSKENCEFTLVGGNYGVVANRTEPYLRVLGFEQHEESEVLSYDARYSHEEARISQDRQTVMLFGLEGFRIYDMAGSLVTEVEIPDADYIYDQQFRKTDQGSWLEVIWYDGTRRCYSAKDGIILTEEKGEAPNKDLREELFTEHYRVDSSLHDSPVVYDRISGKQVAVLEEDGYLTYVTEIEGALLTEYISASGKRYGLLLNSRMEKIAYLPSFCDWDGDRLIFDYESGNLRQSRLYSLQELQTLGETYIKR